MIPGLVLVDPETAGPDQGTGWQVEAACRGMDPDLFFPGRGESTAAARAVCQECPVRQECLDHAMEDGHLEKWGVWGGTTERQRRQLRRARRMGPA